jgi:hypothetical protein
MDDALEKGLRQLRELSPTKRMRLKNGVTFTIRQLDDWRLQEVAEAVQLYTYGFSWEQVVTVKIRPNATIYLVYLPSHYLNRTVVKLFGSLQRDLKKTIRSVAIIVYLSEISEETVEGTILKRKELKCFFPSEAFGQLLLTAVLTGVPPAVVSLLNVEPR